jgi:hypothetical protein
MYLKGEIKMYQPGYDYQHVSSDTRSMHDQCNQYMSYHVVITMNDGSTVDGIIENVGADGVNVLVGEDVMERGEQDERYYGGYGFPRRRFRRFRRQFFPLASLAALALLPYVLPAPYPYPYPYPYY